MANYPRSLIISDDSLFHATWKCHNDDFLLESEFAKKLYYNLLLKYKDKYHITIFSYCFMGNHPHLTGHCKEQKNLSDFFRVVNSCFSKAINRHLNRRGQTVMDRFKSPQIKSDEHLQSVIIYNDLNPFRTKDKIHPQNFKWSSFHHYAYGKIDPLLTQPEFYKNLGSTPKQRQNVYCKMIEEIMTFETNFPKQKSGQASKHALQKQNYSKTFFIGDPLWVKKKHDKLKEFLHKKRQIPKESEQVFDQLIC